MPPHSIAAPGEPLRQPPSQAFNGPPNGPPNGPLSEPPRHEPPAQSLPGRPWPRPLRWGVMALLLLATVALAPKAWEVNLAQTCWRNQWPNPPQCKEVLGATHEEQISRLRERIARNPGDSASRVALATYTQLPGGIPGLSTAQVLDEAEAAAPQNGIVLRLQAVRALQAQQWPQALNRLTRLAAFHNDALARQTMAEMVGLATREPALMAAMREALKADGRWLAPVLGAMPRHKQPMAAALPLILDALPMGGLSPELSQTIVSQLKREGYWLEAHAVWAQLWPKPLGYLFNGGFEQDFVAGGFDWDITDKDTFKAGARVTLAGQGNRGQVLKVNFTGRAIRPPVLRQHLLLPPGKYVFSGEHRSNELRAQEGLTWAFTCVAGGGEVARTPPLKRTGRDWQSWTLAVVVPESCGLGVALSLQTQAPYEAKTGFRGEAMFDRLNLVRDLAPG